MEEYICAIDQGTTGSKALIVDDDLTIHAQVVREFEQTYPEAGWVEQDPEAIWYSTLESIAEARQLAGIEPDQIVSIGITNQRETTVLWDRKTGDPVYNAILWQDRRTADRLDDLRNQGHESIIRESTGLLLDPYFSASKIEWILDNVEGVRGRAENGEIAFGTVDSFLLWRLTGGKEHKTDVSNASRTLLMDLENTEWDEQLLNLFNIPENLLPDIVSSTGQFGSVKNVEPLEDGTPICGLAGDQQAALFGQACFRTGEAKCTYGTGAFLLMNIGEDPVLSDNQLLTSVGWEIENRVTYVLEGSAFMAGAMLQWLRDKIGLIESLEESESLAREVDDSGDVVVVPSLTGLGSPYWKPDARGIITGLTRQTSDAHIVRATLEGIALLNNDLFDAMEDDIGVPLKDVRVDGGASRNDLLVQLQADVLNQSITRPQTNEMTAMGAAMLAGLGAGVFSGLDDLRQEYRKEKIFEPEIAEDSRQKLFTKWNRAVGKI